MSRQRSHDSKHSKSSGITEGKRTVHLEVMLRAQGVLEILSLGCSFGEVGIGGAWHTRQQCQWCIWTRQWGWDRLHMEITTVRALRAQDDPGNAGNCTLEDLGLGMKGFTTKILPVNTGQSGLFSLLCSLQPAMFYFAQGPMTSTHTYPACSPHPHGCLLVYFTLSSQRPFPCPGLFPLRDWCFSSGLSPLI